MTEDQLPETFDELCDYILQYADAIYVRHPLGGKWQSVPLSRLPTKQALAHVFEWMKRGHIPRPKAEVEQ